MSEVQSENIKPESNLVSQTELSRARTSKNNKAAQATLSRARTSKNNKAAQATRSSDELKTQVRFKKSKKISKSIKRIESEMSQIQSQMTRIEKDLGGILRLMQDKGSK